MYKVFIACPSNITTGGPELLHQLCHILRLNNIAAYMYYYDFGIGNNNNTPVSDAYRVYNNPYTTKVEDNVNNVLVIPEVKVELLEMFSKSTKIMWWLSVDNLYDAGVVEWKRPFRKLKYIIDINLNKIFTKKIKMIVSRKLGEFIELNQCEKNKIEKYKLGVVKKQKNCIHLVQSKYAYEYCKKNGIREEKIFYLSDYLNDKFLKIINEGEKNKKREDVVLYNPKKGYVLTKKLIELAPDIKWIPLIGYTREEMIERMCTAKVYIDFGNHPGKDRIPREAAACGCCVITGLRGSANYYEDVPIPSEYKFDENNVDNLNDIICKIKNILLDYETCKKDFDYYREKILNEKDMFQKTAIDIFNEILK